MLPYPQLKIPTRKGDGAAQGWMGSQSGVRQNDIILSISVSEEEGLFCPNEAKIHSWDFIGPSTYLAFPSALYDYVYFNYVLEKHDHAGRLALIQEGLRVLKPGGQLISLSLCCNDSEELYNFAIKQGFDLTRFEAERLTDQDIVRLRPSDGIYTKSLTIVADRVNLVKYCIKIGFSNASLESMWDVKGQFPINRLSVALKWYKAV